MTPKQAAYKRASILSAGTSLATSLIPYTFPSATRLVVTAQTLTDSNVNWGELSQIDMLRDFVQWDITWDLISGCHYGKAWSFSALWNALWSTSPSSMT